jgi:hypothetical protein
LQVTGDPDEPLVSGDVIALSPRKGADEGLAHLT